MVCKTDAMWFCGKCRIVTEQHAVTDIEIERRCKQIMDNYEERITSIENTVDQKYDKDRVKEIVREEIKSSNEDMVKMMVKEEVSKIEAASTEESCNEEKVKAIISEEISKIQNPENTGDGDSPNDEVDNTTDPKRRKSRENNLIVFVILEKDEESKEERYIADKEKLNELFKDCKIQLDKENLKTVKRLGEFNNEN